MGIHWGVSLVMIQCGTPQPIGADRLDEMGVGDMTDGRLAYAEELTRVFRQVIGVLLLSWQRILRVGMITAALVFLITEIIACLVTSSFPPPPATHLVAVALACALGYGAAVTMLFGMILKGGVTFIRYLEGDVALGVHAASVFGRREAGDVGGVLQRVFGGRGGGATSHSAQSRTTNKPRPAIAARGMTTSVAVAAVGRDVARAVTPLPRGTQPDVRRDPDDAIIRTPAPALQSLPVLASQMPRIGWTYDDTQLQPSPRGSTRPRSTAPGDPPTVAEPTSAANGTLPVTVPVTVPVTAPAPDTQAPPPAVAQVESPSAAEAPETMDTSEISRGTPDVPGLIPRGWHYGRGSSATRPPPAITRPLPTVTQPLAGTGATPTPDGGGSGGLWKRVSQALVGQPESAGATDGEHREKPLPMSEVAPEVATRVAPEDAWLIE